MRSQDICASRRPATGRLGVAATAFAPALRPPTELASKRSDARVGRCAASRAARGPFHGRNRAPTPIGASSARRGSRARIVSWRERPDLSSTRAQRARRERPASVGTSSRPRTRLVHRRHHVRRLRGDRRHPCRRLESLALPTRPRKDRLDIRRAVHAVCASAAGRLGPRASWRLDCYSGSRGSRAPAPGRPASTSPPRCCEHGRAARSARSRRRRWSARDASTGTSVAADVLPPSLEDRRRAGLRTGAELTAGTCRERVAGDIVGAAGDHALLGSPARLPSSTTIPPTPRTSRDRGCRAAG